MRRALEKMAKQLNAYDEDSLMSLWEEYAAQTGDFEPTKRWEEAVLVFCLLQAVHWKNQLFNYNMVSTAKPDPDRSSHPANPWLIPLDKKKPVNEEARPKAKILPFFRKADDDC